MIEGFRKEIKKLYGNRLKHYSMAHMREVALQKTPTWIYLLFLKVR